MVREFQGQERVYTFIQCREVLSDMQIFKQRPGGSERVIYVDILGKSNQMEEERQKSKGRFEEEHEGQYDD